MQKNTVGNMARKEPIKKAKVSKKVKPDNDIKPLIKEAVEATLDAQLGVSSIESTKDVELIESLDFFTADGKNKMSIKYSKKSNRSFRIQMFLNDDQEMRPVSYTGSSTGNTFWALLKGALRK